MTQGALAKIVAGLVVVTVALTVWIKQKLAESGESGVLAVDAVLPNASLTGRGGEAIDLHAYAADHEVVLLSFWASWSKSCQMEMPGLRAIYREYQDDGLGILAVSIDRETDALDAFLADNPVPFPVAQDREGELLERYGFEVLPSAVVIDRDAKIVQVLRGGETRMAPLLIHQLVGGVQPAPGPAGAPGAFDFSFRDGQGPQ